MDKKNVWNHQPVQHRVDIKVARNPQKSSVRPVQRPKPRTPDIKNNWQMGARHPMKRSLRCSSVPGLSCARLVKSRYQPGCPMAKEVQSASMVHDGSIESSIAARSHGTCHSDGVSLEKGFHRLSQTKELRSKIAQDLVDKVLVGGIDHEDRAKVVFQRVLTGKT